MDNVLEVIKKYRLIKNGEKIAVACSGGKDSMSHQSEKRNCELRFLFTSVFPSI